MQRLTDPSRVVRVLVVDDDPPLARTLKINLESRGYAVVAARTGEDALSATAHYQPAAVILDLGLPGMDGLRVIEGLRGWSDVPILVLSAREAEHDKVAALDAGADDYVSKPFSMGELLARLRATLRRVDEPDTWLANLATSDFAIDFAAKVLTVRGERRTLTPTEWRMIEYLARNPDRLIGQRQLLDAVWGDATGPHGGYVHTYTKSLRRKLEPDPSKPIYLLTEVGLGIRFVPYPEGS